MLQHAKEKVIQYNEYEKKYGFPTSTVKKLGLRPCETTFISITSYQNDYSL
jgi:hypothetical protein